MTHDPGRSLARVLALTVLVGVLGACGDSRDEKSAAGSPSNPLVATGVAGSEGAPEVQRATDQPGQEAAAAAGSVSKPGYEDLVKDQSRKPAERFTPCNLVTKAQAAAIIGGPVLEPIEASQGPTCIYRGASGRDFVTVAVQAGDLATITSRLRRPRRVDVANRRAYCATTGQPTLYVAVSDDRVLTIAAPCQVAKRFAARAALRLSS